MYWERFLAWMVGFCSFSAIVFLSYFTTARILKHFKKKKPARQCENCLWLSERRAGFHFASEDGRAWTTVFMCGLPEVSPVMYVAPEHSCDQFKQKGGE